MGKRKAIIVAGMHRSGTSAVTGALSLMGVSLGKKITGPAHDNKKGFFESEAIYKINDLILRSLGRPWTALAPLPPSWLEGSSLAFLRKRLMDIIRSEFENQDIIAIKDPRICRLLPLWKDILGELGIEYSFAIPVRHPVEVAKSLQKRNGLTIEHATLLWADYMLNAERHSCGHRRIIFPFNDLMNDTENVINRIAGHCGVNFPRSVGEALPEISEFLDKGLISHNLGAAEREYMLPVVADIYDTILGLCYNRSPDSPESGRIDMLTDKLLKACVFFYPSGVKICAPEKKKKSLKTSGTLKSMIEGMTAFINRSKKPYRA